ncbi:diguanylate cyclase [Deltaproteobacteria bacterium]|nr:diguanylate cyclase [Deltaproteobacteria bacterium]
MQRKSPSQSKEIYDSDKFVRIIKSSRYFRNISLDNLKEILYQGEFVSLRDGDYLMHDKQFKPPELIILLEGSLVVTSKNHFFMRLNHPGDIFGEMSIISDNPNSYANVISEEDSLVVIFPKHLFKISEEDTKVSIVYYLFAHILAEKIRHITARSQLNNSTRLNKEPIPLIGILDSDKQSRKKIKSTLEKIWINSRVIEINSYHNFFEKPFENNFDFIITDPEMIIRGSSQKDEIRNLIEICSSHMAPMLVISQYCEKLKNRQFLSELGVTDFLTKPFSTFDLQHLLSKFRKDHYILQELKNVEIMADTDRLTGLANRRRMDEFLEAIFNLFPEEKQPFSLIIADVDQFKQYNDAHGHQLGDIILASVAAIIKKCIRRGDLAARFGGDEFVVILPNCDKENAVLIANKIRVDIAKDKFKYQQQQLGKQTCTFGVATFPEDADTTELLLKKADDSLYKAKSDGRNKVIAVKPL